MDKPKLNPVGTIYLIPVPLAEEELKTIPEYAKQKAIEIKHYFVENIRTARRYLKQIDRAVVIDEIVFSEMNQHEHADLNLLEKWLKAGKDIGVMSEAGCPAVADPGSIIVAKAQELNAKIVPFVGPNSILLALMASGFNGQGFRFVGYLPVKNLDKKSAIIDLEMQSSKGNETQIFIETPYRNNQLLEDLIKFCKPSTKICIAVNITDNTNESIQTKTIAQWKMKLPDLHKKPAIFLLFA